MPCTTILVGKKASFDGSTMIARNDDGSHSVKKLVIVNPKDQPRKYKTVDTHCVVELPDNPLKYTMVPNVNYKEGLWPTNGINELNVGMTATETTTTNPRVVSSDPFVKYQPKEGKQKEVAGGIGEVDYVSLVLPYVKTAKEAVIRLGSLLEQYGTDESNGIAFNDENECWWMETIGGHHWMAARVKDDEVVIMPNQFGLDNFDLDDAFGKQENYLCSKDLREFIVDNHLDLNNDGKFNPRLIFGSDLDSDYIYNTPRAWDMARHLLPRTYKWLGDNADFTPLSNDIPWSIKPEKKISIDDIKKLLALHFQGTEYDPYGYKNDKRGMFRSISCANTDTMSILQIRGYMPKELKGIQWICYGPTSFNALVPVYTSGNKIPAYLGKTTLELTTENFYWASRIMATLCDSHFVATDIHNERYQKKICNKVNEIIKDYDKKFMEKQDISLLDKANQEMCDFTKKETNKVLQKLMWEVTDRMKIRYHRSDN